MPLGKKPDARIAREYGIPQPVVTRHRNKLGIGSFKSALHESTKNRWDNAGLGTCFDRVIAEKFGVHVSCVIRERQKRNIPAYQNSLGRTARAYPIDWSTIPLGKKSDGELGRELGVSGSCVRRQRIKRKIPSFKEKCIITDWSKIPLGKVPDSLLAIMLNKSVDAIAVARSSRGIPPYTAVCKTTEGEPCTVPEGLVDLFWHEKAVPHRFQVRFGRFVADWVINEDTVVEYAGWEDHPKYGRLYRERLERKKTHYRKLGFKILIINRNNLNDFKPRGMPAYTRACAICHRPVSHYQKGLCKACYKREYLRPKKSQ